MAAATTSRFICKANYGDLSLPSWHSFSLYVKSHRCCTLDSSNLQRRNFFFSNGGEEGLSFDVPSQVFAHFARGSSAGGYRTCWLVVEQNETVRRSISMLRRCRKYCFLCKNHIQFSKPNGFVNKTVMYLNPVAIIIMSQIEI